MGYAIAVLVACVLAAVPFVLDSALTKIVIDAQAGIVVLFSAVASAVTFVTALALGLIVAHGVRRRAWVGASVAGVLLAVLTAVTADRVVKTERARAALLAAADPATPADRLVALDGAWTPFGYELDNRLAGHPNSPPELLRRLNGRKDQLGTSIRLAGNPNTPPDVLRELSESDDEWVRKSLATNPAFAEPSESGVGPPAAGR